MPLTNITLAKTLAHPISSHVHGRSPPIAPPHLAILRNQLRFSERKWHRLIHGCIASQRRKVGRSQRSPARNVGTVRCRESIVERFARGRAKRRNENVDLFSGREGK